MYWYFVARVGWTEGHTTIWRCPKRIVSMPGRFSGPADQTFSLAFAAYSGGSRNRRMPVTPS